MVYMLQIILPPCEWALNVIKGRSYGLVVFAVSIEDSHLKTQALVFQLLSIWYV